MHNESPSTIYEEQTFSQPIISEATSISVQERYEQATALDADKLESPTTSREEQERILRSFALRRAHSQ